MYSEKTFKNYIFWIQVKRIVIILLLTCIGAAIGVLVSELCESITKSNAFNVLIIAGTTVFMFLFSLLLTTSTGKEVQDGYWKIAVLRKLTTIQKLIESNNSLLSNGNSSFNKEIDLSVQKITEGLVSTTTSDLEYEEDDVESENVKIKVKSADKKTEKVEENKLEKKPTDLVAVKKKKGNKKRNITKVKELV